MIQTLKITGLIRVFINLILPERKNNRNLIIYFLIEDNFLSETGEELSDEDKKQFINDLKRKFKVI